MKGREYETINNVGYGKNGFGATWVIPRSSLIKYRPTIPTNHIYREKSQ